MKKKQLLEENEQLRQRVDVLEHLVKQLELQLKQQAHEIYVAGPSQTKSGVSITRAQSV